MLPTETTAEEQLAQQALLLLADIGSTTAAAPEGQADRDKPETIQQNSNPTPGPMTALWPEIIDQHLQLVRSKFSWQLLPHTGLSHGHF